MLQKKKEIKEKKTREMLFGCGLYGGPVEPPMGYGG